MVNQPRKIHEIHEETSDVSIPPPPSLAPLLLLFSIPVSVCCTNPGGRTTGSPAIPRRLPAFAPPRSYGYELLAQVGRCGVTGPGALSKLTRGRTDEHVGAQGAGSNTYPPTVTSQFIAKPLLVRQVSRHHLCCRRPVAVWRPPATQHSGRWHSTPDPVGLNGLHGVLVCATGSTVPSGGEGYT